MKFAFSLSTLLAAFTFGCGAAQDSQERAGSQEIGSTLLAAAPASAPRTPPLKCTIQTINGRYLTAVGGGGRVSDVLHTDATRANAWEQFILEDTGDGTFHALKTKTGHYLTVMGGGGRINDVIHSNATQLQAWEKLRLWSTGDGYYGLQTVNGNWLTAVSGGGRITDVIHSDATQLLAWEKFKFNCSLL